jgi:NCS1 family nucleobase:cation symporter-1
MPPCEGELRKGNLWGLPVNLLAFCLVAGVTTTAAFTVYNEVLLHPDQISGQVRQRGSWPLLAALTFAVATLGINVVANFVSPAFRLRQHLPAKINFKRGGYIAAALRWCSTPGRPGKRVRRIS